MNAQEGPMVFRPELGGVPSWAYQQILLLRDIRFELGRIGDLLERKGGTPKKARRK